MIKDTFKKVAVLGLGTSMALSSLMMNGALAATHDATEEASSPTATIQLGKILDVNQAGKFPRITDFNMTLERVEGWKNANVTAATNGTALQTSEIPMPAASSTANHTISVSGNTATVAVGNFSASDTNDTTTQKKRVTDVPITYTEAGYYVYKVKEISSTPASVPGVTYDDHEYFVVVYVANCTDQNGNTVDGVYVHDITSYRNTSDDDTYMPTLSDISQVTDNGGTAAQENNSTNLGKVGKSTAEHPNQLEAYRMFNSSVTSDVKVSKNVTGNLGVKGKEFPFTMTLTGLEKNASYVTSTGSVAIDSCSVGTKVSGTEFTTDANGAATLAFKLKDDEFLNVEALPATAQYTVSEAASDHKASYAITAEGGNDATIATATAANDAYNTALATSTETVNPADGDVEIAYTNEKTETPPTGIAVTLIPIAIAGAALSSALVLVKRRKESEVEDID